MSSRTPFIDLAAPTLQSRGAVSIQEIGSVVTRQSRCTILKVEPRGERFVLKVMSDDYRYTTRASVEHEFNAVNTFYQATRGRADIESPQPIELFNRARGYLMTLVEGTPLDALTINSPLSDRDARAVVTRIARGLRLFHQCVDEPYGDFHPGNVLVDPSSLRVGLIDPTMPNPIYRIAPLLAEASFLSADLGYWAYSVAARAPKIMATRPQAAQRLFRLTDELMHASACIDAVDIDELRADVYRVADWHVRRLARSRGTRKRMVALLARRFLKRMQREDLQI